MIASDFKFDGTQAGDIGLIICSFDGSGLENMQAGTTINFNQVSIQHGAKFLNTATTYDSVLDITFQVARFNCKTGQIEPFSLDDQRMMGRWLNKKSMKEFVLIGYDSDYDDLYFEGSFDSITKIQINHKVYGYELHFITNRPYAMGAPVDEVIELDGENDYEFLNLSDEVGYIYPSNLKITCKAPGDLEITNKLEGRTTVFKDVTMSCVIYIDEMQNVTAPTFTIYEDTIFPGHPDLVETEEVEVNYDVANNYNYRSFRIARTEDDNVNIISSTLPCKIEFSYNPIYKGVGF